MDPIKAQNKFKIKQEELVEEAKNQLESLTKPITDPEEYERVMNLKDLMLSRLNTYGFIQEENKGYFLIAVFRSIIDQYWTQKSLEKAQRAIYDHSYTDKELKKIQMNHYKSLQKKAQEYKKIMNEWWRQRSEEEEFLNKPMTKPSKAPKAKG